MRIIIPAEIEHTAWEGALVSLGEAAFRGSVTPPRVSLGELAWWPAAQAMESEMGRKWVPPADGRRYTLACLGCTLHPPEEPRAAYTEAVLSLRLRPRQGQGAVVAHDLLPLRVTAETTGKLIANISPSFTFGGAEISLGEIGAEIGYDQVYPVIQAYGLGENDPYWRFEAHARHPLIGAQKVLAALAAPAHADGVLLEVDLTATLKTRWGLRRFGLPTGSARRCFEIVDPSTAHPEATA